MYSSIDAIRWSCRLWLCSCMCGLRVNACFFLLEYMSLWWLYWWWYGSVYDGKKMIMVIPKWLKECHLKCVKVKYVVSCLGWLVSLNWCLYCYEYVMYSIIMLKSLSFECIIFMRPWIMLGGSFMWNLEPSGKVMYVEVESRNGILQSKGWWT